MTILIRSRGHVDVLEIGGRFDAHVAPKIKDGQDQAGTSSRVVVNLAGVSFIDSAGMAVLVRGMKRCRQAGGDNLDRAFEVCASENEAVAAFGPER
jgi:anti-sigma B factor antagonist